MLESNSGLANSSRAIAENANKVGDIFFLKYGVLLLLFFIITISLSPYLVWFPVLLEEDCCCVVVSSLKHLWYEL
jgi:hypothetical protein